MERMRVEEFGESKDEDCGLVNLVFLQGFSLKILSGGSLHFMGIRVFIVVCMRNAKSHVLTKQGILATRPRDWNELRANGLTRLEVLSGSAPAVVTLQFLCMLHTCATFGDLPVVRSNREALFECTHLEFSSHSLTHYLYIIPTYIQDI